MKSYFTTHLQAATLLLALVVTQCLSLATKNVSKNQHQFSISYNKLVKNQNKAQSIFSKILLSGIYIDDIRKLHKIFKKNDYDLKKAKYGREVPRFYLARIPKNIKKQKFEGHTKQARKETFIKIVLPLILRVNEKISLDRNRLIALKEHLNRGNILPHNEKIWLIKLANEYRCKSTNIDALLVHVDIIPPSLALAQAILESGWGTSFAAINKNSTFGHMATVKEVRAFKSLFDNVCAYILNLNRHLAYTGFRESRANMRTKRQSLCSLQLVSTLKKYSIRGENYINDLKNLIHSNSLKEYDLLSLKEDQTNIHIKP